jgi:hypothetical protein
MGLPDETVRPEVLKAAHDRARPAHFDRDHSAARARAVITKSIA